MIVNHALRLDERPLPWPSLAIPPYRATAHTGLDTARGWKLIEKKGHIAADGYFRGLTWIADRKQYALLDADGKVWMSVSPMELESQSLHLAAARGEVVIMGLGMGALLFNVLAKPEVTRVTVVEKDPAIPDLLSAISPLSQWAGIDKLSIVMDDALDYRHPRPVDVLLVDIWPHLADSRALGDMTTIQRHVQAARVGWWGQEFDIVSFLQDKGRKPPVTDDDLAWFAREMGLPIVGPEYAEYNQLIVDAVAQSVFSPLTASASAIAWNDPDNPPLHPRITVKQARALGVRFPDVPFQWHLTTTAHDRCPKCGSSEIGNTGARSRACLSRTDEECRGNTWTLKTTAQKWLREMVERGERHITVKKRSDAGRKPQEA